MTQSEPLGKSDTLSFWRLLPGFLRIAWRYPSIRRNYKELMEFSNDSFVSIGTALEYNAETNPDGAALLCEDLRFSHHGFNEAVNPNAK